MPDLGGWLWLVIDVGMVTLLGAAMIYGIIKWRQRRNMARQQFRNRETRNLYSEEEAKRRAIHEV